MDNNERGPGSGRRSHGERPAVEWERAVKSFTENGYTVQIDRLPLGRPRFSISIGILRDGDSFTSRIGARYNYANGKVTFETVPPPGLVDHLIELASEWIEQEVLASEERYQERQQRRKPGPREI